MKCFICKKYFNYKKTFKNLFEIDKDIICEQCYKRYPINLDYSVVPLERHYLKIYSLHKIIFRINEHAYINEYSRIFNYLFDNKKRVPILLYNRFYLNESNIYKMELVSTLFESDVYIICNNLVF